VIRVAALIALASGVAAADSPTPAPVEAAIVVAPPPEIDAMARRLAGHRVRVGDGALVVDDIAGDGRPWIGVVERRGDALWLVTAVAALELRGPLARPRIAGPGYLVWVIGTRDASRIVATRLGVLQPPRP
jgi:hypothetical protein